MVMKLSKYKSKKVTIDNITFDSKMEGQYYLHLNELKSKGEIKDFTLQPEFILQPKFEKDGKKYLPIKYKADFKVIHNDNKVEIVDIKGFTTTDFKLKNKMFNYHFEHPLSLLTYSKIDGGWIEVSDLKKARAQRKKDKNK